MRQKLQQFPVKDPRDRLDETFNFTPSFPADDTDEVESATVTAEPSGEGHLTVVAVDWTGKVVTVLVEGGQINTNYTLTCEAVTANGRVINRAAILPVADR